MLIMLSTLLLNTLLLSFSESNILNLHVSLVDSYVCINNDYSSMPTSMYTFFMFPHEVYKTREWVEQIDQVE